MEKLSDFEWYEIKAEAFRICTGHMAPGKDPSPLSYPAPFEERAAAWDKWTTENLKITGAFLTAFNRIMADEGR